MRRLTPCLFAITVATIFAAAAVTVPALAAEPEIELWPSGMPEPKVTADKPEESALGADGIDRRSNISKPRIVVYEAPADLRTGAAALVVPGGGFGMLADGHEGTAACKWLNELGITAFLLRHRCPTHLQEKPNLGPAQDVQRAIQLIREQSEKWKVDSNKVGLFGYSAGGQVALVAATNPLLFPKEGPAKKDNDKEGKETANYKPDFMILSYAYQIYDPQTGKLRSDVHVENGLPATFIAQCADDGGSLAQGSTLLFLECLNHKIPAELHIYEKGGHGYGMRKVPDATGPTDWADRLEDWLVLRGLGKKPKGS